MANQIVCPICRQFPHSEFCHYLGADAMIWTQKQIDARASALRPVLECDSRDPAEEACYEIQKALWEFQTAIERCESAGRLAFIDGMLAESRKRLELVIVALGSKSAELDKLKGLAQP